MGHNRLSSESSLYLKQHAENPVHWWPWCDEAFELAAKENKPVLVSIGYSSCHWCHVMAHECFEDEYIASLMNRMFINIKVDREERPDVDQIYMEAIQMLNQQGGWPLNVFCFPDKKPFTGGTYFPPDDRGHGIVPWPHLLLRISDAFKNEQASLKSNADAIQQNLDFLSGSTLEGTAEWSDDVLKEGASSILSALDPHYGGFGAAPKFPPSQILGFLYGVRALENPLLEQTELTLKIDEALQLCTHALTRGGLFDHVGGGFFRYSVDAKWQVPHFEKMLYDNALILDALSKTWSLNRWSGIESAVRKTVTWLLNEFQVKPGVFAAAMDADTEAGEGAYYTWSEAELRESVPAQDVDAFLEDFSVHGNDPLNLYPWAVDEAAYRNYSLILNDLKDIRDERERPVLDEKILLSWNGLLLRGLAVAGTIFGEVQWLQVCKTGLDWIWEQMRRTDGSLSSVFYPGTGAKEKGKGFLDDYVHFALGTVHFAMVADRIEPGLHKTYLARASSLLQTIVDEFSDPKGENEGYFFCTEEDSNSLIVRKKEWFDNAYPSGNSGVVYLLALLKPVLLGFDVEKKLAGLKSAYAERSRRMPNGVAFGLEALSWDRLGVLVLKVGTGVNVSDVFSAIGKKTWRPYWLMVDERLEEHEIQVCEGFSCHPPTQQLEVVLKFFEI